MIVQEPFHLCQVVNSDLASEGVSLLEDYQGSSPIKMKIICGHMSEAFSEAFGHIINSFVSPSRRLLFT
jgi:hypothetical protein